MARITSLETRVLLILAFFCLNKHGRGVVDAYTCGEPLPPTMLVATSHNASAFTLTWGLGKNPVHCLVGVRVCLHQPAGSYDCLFLSCDDLGGCANSNSWSSDGSRLQTATCAKHVATVAAVYDFLGIDGRISEASSVQFQAAPVGVSDLSAAGTTGNSTLLEWKASTSYCADHYNVSWCAVAYPWSEDCRPTSHLLSADSTSFSITGMAPCTNYRITVTTVSGISGPRTEDTLVVTTPSGGLGAVQHLTVGVSGDEVALSWDVRQEDRTCTADYEVCWQDEQGNTTCRLDEPGALLRLDYCSEYNVSVRAIDMDNSSSQPVVHHITTGAEKVHNLTATNVTARSATLTWEPSPSSTTCGLSYLVSWCAQTDANDPPCEPTARQKLPVNSTRHSISGLTPCLPHHVSIVTNCVGGLTSGAHTITIQTSLDELEPPQDVNVNVVSSALTMVEFSPPKESGRCISSYVGCLRQDGVSESRPVCLPSANLLYWANWDNHTTPCTNYTLELTVFSTDGRNASKSVSFTSGAGEVAGLRAANATSNTSSAATRLTWDVASPSGCVPYQLVMWALADGNGTGGEARVSRDATQVLLEGLEPCSRYQAGVMEQASTPSVVESIEFYSASNVTAASGLAVTCEPGKPAAVLSFFAPPSPRCVANYSVCWGPGQAPSPDWSCRDVGGTGHVSVALAGLNRSEQYGCSVTPVAPDCRPYSTARLAFNYTCSGCVSAISPSIGVLVLLPGVLRRLLSRLQ
ncbi:tenascin-R-like [Bacillus rossius redtenbacheri]|uniref:tenascin-R-like n=1 Tax=Bacillus rossius redtenbacheri TaxID=93214 RepID=UPI002FDEB28A